MLYRLRRHPFPVSAHFEWSLVLTFAWPRQVLEELLAPGLRLDTEGDLGYMAAAFVQTRGLRPSWLPRALGLNFFLSGYRVFTRLDTGPRSLRGLRILRSDTDSWFLTWVGNLTTHYGYRKVSVDSRKEGKEIDLNVHSAETPLALRAVLAEDPPLPPGSPFQDWREARRYAGPLPFTFSYEKETHSMVVVEGVREHWQPRPLAVERCQVGFFDRPPFRGVQPQLAAAFWVEDIPYRWKAGWRVPVACMGPRVQGGAGRGSPPSAVP